MKPTVRILLAALALLAVPRAGLCGLTIREVVPRSGGARAGISPTVELAPAGLLAPTGLADLASGLTPAGGGEISPLTAVAPGARLELSAGSPLTEGQAALSSETPIPDPASAAAPEAVPGSGADHRPVLRERAAQDASSDAPGAAGQPLRATLKLLQNELPFSEHVFDGGPKKPAEAGVIRPDYSPVAGSPDLALLERTRAQFEAIRPAIDLEDPGVRREVDSMAAALARADWSHPVFADPERAVHLALAAYRRAPAQGAVTLGQFATVVLRWETAQHLGVPASRVRAVPLIERGELTGEARRLFGKGGMRYLGDIDAPDVLERLKVELNRLPESERYVFVAEGTAEQIAKTSLPPYDPQSKDALTPAAGVIQAALRAKFGDNAVGMQLAFGRAETDDLPEGIVRGGRIFGLGYPGVWQPGTFHEVLEGLWLYSMHDIYHLVWGSRMPIWARQVPVRLYQLALDYLRWAASPAAGGEAPIVMPDQTQWDFATSAVVDMDWEIGVAGFAQFLTQWFGPLEQADGKVSLSALVLRDMGRHPGLWAGWGFDAQSAAALARELGPVGPELLESGRAASRKGL